MDILFTGQLYLAVVNLLVAYTNYYRNTSFVFRKYGIKPWYDSHLFVWEVMSFKEGSFMNAVLT